MRALSAFLYMLFSTVQGVQYLTKCFTLEIVSYVGNLHICNFIDPFPLFVKILLACNSFRFFVIYLPSLMVKER